LTAETSINTAWYHVVAGGEIAVKGLKIRCPKGRAGSTPALGTSSTTQLLYSTDLIALAVGLSQSFQ
jgi:hypothetical protein